MTCFQENCVALLKSNVMAQNLTFHFLQEKQGMNEKFIHGKLGDTEFWIYEDMADIRTINHHWLFEPSDYDSPCALIEAFVNAVLQPSS